MYILTRQLGLIVREKGLLELVPWHSVLIRKVALPECVNMLVLRNGNIPDSTLCPQLGVETSLTTGH